MERRMRKYQILHEIASGGQATVYLAYDRELDRRVALKVLHHHLSVDSQYVGRFLQEARLAASINHPNVVTIYEVGQENDQYFITMEYLPTSLDQMLQQRGRLPVATAVSLVAQVARGVQAAHDKGIIHRDLKPQNILLTTDGTPKVSDFGIARAGQLSTMTATGMVMGTPFFMSPEQGKGEQVDARSDVYSLGCVIYQMLTGELPFQGTSAYEVIRQHIEERPPPLREVRRDVPQPVAEVVERALAKEPTSRFQSMAELAAALQQALPDGPLRDQQVPDTITYPSGAAVSLPRKTPPPAPAIGCDTEGNGPELKRLPPYSAVAVAVGLLIVGAIVGWALIGNPFKPGLVFRVTPTEVHAGERLVFSYSGLPPDVYAFNLTINPVNSPDVRHEERYLIGVKTEDTIKLPAPNIPGTYEARIYSNGFGVLYGKSQPFEVLALPAADAGNAGQPSSEPAESAGLYDSPTPVSLVADKEMPGPTSSSPTLAPKPAFSTTPTPDARQSPLPTFPPTVTPTSTPLPVQFTYIAELKIPKDSEEQAIGPLDIATDYSGNIYITERNTRRVTKLRQNGEVLTRWGRYDGGDGEFVIPSGIATDESGYVYVVDTNEHTVQKFDQDGKFLTKWDSRGSGEGQFKRPFDIAIDPAGNVYVLDSGNFRVQKFDASGEYLTHWGGKGTGEGQFDFTYSRGRIAVDGKGNVYVLDHSLFLLQIFDSNGNFLRKWSTAYLGDTINPVSTDIAVASDGEVYIVESAKNRVLRFSPEGTPLGTWGEAGQGNGQFQFPTAIDIDQNGFIYVLDGGNERVQVFRKEFPK